MKIEYEISDEKITGFTESAKERLGEQSKKFTLEIISEAEKVEKLVRENGASTEITDNIVFQAVRRNKTGKKKNIGLIIVKLLSELLLFISGLMFSVERFVADDGKFNLVYFVFFAIITIAAIILTSITYFIGD